jgi:hypothetical protein
MLFCRARQCIAYGAVNVHHLRSGKSEAAELLAIVRRHLREVGACRRDQRRWWHDVEIGLLGRSQGSDHLVIKRRKLALELALGDARRRPLPDGFAGEAKNDVAVLLHQLTQCHALNPSPNRSPTLSPRQGVLAALRACHGALDLQEIE